MCWMKYKLSHYSYIPIPPPKAPQTAIDIPIVYAPSHTPKCFSPISATCGPVQGSFGKGLELLPHPLHHHRLQQIELHPEAGVEVGFDAGEGGVRALAHFAGADVLEADLREQASQGFAVIDDLVPPGSVKAASPGLDTNRAESGDPVSRCG